MSEHIIEVEYDTFNGTYTQKRREEIVRCRDCEWFGEDKSDHEYRSGWWCDRLDFDTIEYGFCHLGERRADHD